MRSFFLKIVIFRENDSRRAPALQAPRAEIFGGGQPQKQNTTFQFRIKKKRASFFETGQLLPKTTTTIVG
jgi:hypothetical protein